jgi:alkyl sulfatase BDS1-like metallo-beta-lactamase superfamily hydrolase
MASVEECDRAFSQLADRLAANSSKPVSLDRTLSCSLPDIGAIFGARLHDGRLEDIQRVDSPDAQVRLSMSSDDLLQMVAGKLNFAGAWASGRVKVHARPMDLIKLRSIF